MNKISIVFPAAVLVSIHFLSCTESLTVNNTRNISTPFDLEGHRGCRGLLPENSIPAMLRAAQLGVNTLEMDVVISKDNKVLLSHEPFLSHEICLTTDGDSIKEEKEKNFNLYKMDYTEIINCDCGTLRHKRFPGQQKIKAYKPLLSEVIDSVEGYLKTNSLPLVQYNIEIKSTPETDFIFHPEPGTYSELLLDVLKEKKLLESGRIIIQSFDVRPLQYLHEKYPGIRLSFLVENTYGHEKNLELLGFIPEIFSPDFNLITPELIKFGRANNMKIIPWTLNNPEEINKALNSGVNGIITDYPDMAKNIILQYKPNN